MVTGSMIKVLMAFYHQVAQRITGMMAKRGARGEWEYLLVEESKEATGINSIGLYIYRRQKIVAEKSCRPVYTLCIEAEQMQGTIQLV